FAAMSSALSQSSRSRNFAFRAFGYKKASATPLQGGSFAVTRLLEALLDIGPIGFEPWPSDLMRADQCLNGIRFDDIESTRGLRDLHRSFRERILCPLKHFFGPLDVFYRGIAWDHRSRPNRNIATDLDFRPQRVVTDLRNRCL